MKRRVSRVVPALLSGLLVRPASAGSDPPGGPASAAPSPWSWELAAGPWVGQHAPQASATREVGLAWGGRARVRWTEWWAAELLVGTTPQAVTGNLALVRFLGDPSADLVGHAALGLGLRSTRDALVTVGGGFDIALVPFLDLRVDTRLEVDTRGEAALLVAVAPLVHTRRAYDADGDGLPDRGDTCPRVAEDPDGFADTDGCPDPDNDADAVADTEDVCPDRPEDRDGMMDRDGCPDPDDDEDGVYDSVDACLRAPEDRDAFEDEDGCPDPDNDRDTVPDGFDRCPDVAEDLDLFEDDDGCPDPDNDADGVADRWDDAPLEPEVYNAWEDEDGRPDVVPPVVQRVLGRLDVRFEPGTMEDGTPAERPVGSGLELLAAVLASFPQARVEVRVYARAAELAQARAMAVADALAAPTQVRLAPEVGDEGVDVRLARP